MTYTSYFAKLTKFDLPNPISISTYPPVWFSGKEYKTLSPGNKILMAYKNNEIDNRQYTILFNKKLNKLNAAEVLEELCSLNKSKNFTLLCYEKPSDFCHRHLVADWLNKNLNTAIKEYSNAPKNSISLFDLTK